MRDHSVNHTKILSRLAAFCIAVAVAVSAFANDSKISPDLLPLLANANNQVNVIIQYNTTPPVCGTGLLGSLLCVPLKLVGGLQPLVFSLINAVTGKMLAGDVIALSNQLNVAYITLDRPLRASLDYSASAVNAPLAWNAGWRGTGVGIAVIDSGIYPHPDLMASPSGQSRIVYRQNFIGGGHLVDDYGHGTHVAGIAAGDGVSSAVPGTSHLLRGIAPGANLLDLRVLDANGMSNDSVVIAAIQKAVQLKNTYNVRVINLSLGRPIYEGCQRDPLCQAVESAWQNGIVVVIAAGNLGRNGYATITSPGNSPRAITVGCMKTLETYPASDDQIASYSSKGPTYIDLTVKPDLVAPGNQVVSLLAPGSTLAAEFSANIVPSSYYAPAAQTGPAEYFRLSGTSMATPVVSGTVAVMLQKNPSLNPDTVKARLMKTAAKSFPAYSTASDPDTGAVYASTYDIFTIGAGYLDINAALASSDVTSRSAASPSVLYNAATQQAYLLTASTGIWSSSAAWGLPAVWGSIVFLPGSTGNTAIGGSAIRKSAAWGSSGDWASSAAWGSSVDGEN